MDTLVKPTAITRQTAISLLVLIGAAVVSMRHTAMLNILHCSDVIATMREHHLTVVDCVLWIAAPVPYRRVGQVVHCTDCLTSLVLLSRVHPINVIRVGMDRS